MSSDLIVQDQQQAISAYGNLSNQSFNEIFAGFEKAGKALSVTFNLDTPHHGTIMMLTCASENLSVSNYHKRYHGDGTMRASAVQAEFMRRGGVIDWDNLGDDGKVASAKFSHPTFMKKARLIEYTIDDARRQVGAKMDKDGSNWKTNPGAMLRAALIRKAVKLIDPGVIGGFDDFNDMDASPVNATVTVIDQSTVDARKAELAELAKQSASVVNNKAEVIVDVESEPAVVEKKEDDPPRDEDDPTNADAVETKEELCTNDQLQELAAIGLKLPSNVTAGQNMDLKEIMDGLCAASQVDNPSKMTHVQAASLIERFKGELSKL